MIALRLVRFIEAHSDALATRLLEKFMHSPQTSDLKKVPSGELHQRSHEILHNLGSWLVNPVEADLERVYRQIGARRAAQGVALAHLLAAILMTKEHLWGYLEKQGILEKPAEVFGELELLGQLDRFFDRAVYYATRGYEDYEHTHHHQQQHSMRAASSFSCEFRQKSCFAPGFAYGVSTQRIGLRKSP